MLLDCLRCLFVDWICLWCWFCWICVWTACVYLCLVLVRFVWFESVCGFGLFVLVCYFGLISGLVCFDLGCIIGVLLRFGLFWRLVVWF